MANEVAQQKYSNIKFYIAVYIYIDVKYIIMENVNECSKGIGLGTIFKNILHENDKTINFVDNFLYFL